MDWLDRKVPGVNCQEVTKEELLESPRSTLREVLGFNRKEVLTAVERNYDEEQIAI